MHCCMVEFCWQRHYDYYDDFTCIYRRAKNIWIFFISLSKDSPFDASILELPSYLAEKR